MKIIKRSGEEQQFDARKIRNAIRKANATVSKVDELTDEQMDRITEYVTQACEGFQRPVGVEEIQDIVEKQLMAMGAFDVAKNYIVYRKKRERARDTIKIRGGSKDKGDVTDQSLLLVNSMTQNNVSVWDRSKIVARLMSSLGMTEAEAGDVAKDVESQVIASGLSRVNSALVRELVNNALLDHGYKGQLQDLTMYKVPRDFIESLMHTKSVENSNIVSNNPEAVNMALADLVLKQWALDAVFSPDVKSAHETGAIHLHDLQYPHRQYCGSHSIEYLKKFGLRGLCNLNIVSKPAKSASVLTGHLNTYMASMQAYYAGALGLGYVNVFYAPMLIDMDRVQLHQIAQELIFNASQNAFSRGSQTLFSDFNIHTGIPKYLRGIPAIGPGGRYMLLQKGKEKRDWVPLEEATTKDGHWQLSYNGMVFVDEYDGVQHFQDNDKWHVLTYGDFAEEAMAFCSALLSVWKEGDANGHVFEFPKCDFHVDADSFADPDQNKLFMEACDLASHNGSTYFVFDRDSVSLSSCCRLRVQITDMSLLTHPEKLRTTGFQNITINIPQCAYRAKRNGKLSLDGILEEVDKMMELCVKAHLQKRASVEHMMSGPGEPLWQLGKPANDGSPYVELDKCVYIIGLIGVNDAIQFLTGKQLHESDEVLDMGLKIIAHMFLRAKEYSEKYNMTFKLEESPAESAARRLAKADLMYFREDALKVYKGGDEDFAYYTNSIHLAADAPVTLVARIRKQSMFHSAIESGAIIHAFIGEEQPNPEAIAQLVREVFLNTQAAQLTFSPEFTYCEDCGAKQRGIQDKCSVCGSGRVVNETRVVGYFSRIQSWNKSKRYGELVGRHAGDYAVCNADDAEEAK